LISQADLLALHRFLKSGTIQPQLNYSLLLTLYLSALNAAALTIRVWRCYCDRSSR